VSTRDLTLAQFLAALARNGFKHTPGPLPYFTDLRHAHAVHFGAILTRDGRTLRRATIKHLLASRARVLADPKLYGWERP